jgi:AraC-like DNA-binding protein
MHADADVLGEGERLIYRRSDAVPGVEELLVYRSSRLWRVFHESYSVSTGPGTATAVKYRNVRHEIAGRGILVTEPGEIHQNEWLAAPLDFCVAFVDPAAMREAATELGLGAGFHFKVGLTDAPRVYRAFRQFHESMDQPTDALECESRLAAALRLLLGCCAERAVPEPRPHHPRALSRVRDVLEARYAENVSLAELAGVAGINRFHLVHAFARQYGLPPHAYRIAVRVTKARTLLALGVPPAEVALATGFSDQSHLTRAFRCFLGVPPAHYQATTAVGAAATAVAGAQRQVGGAPSRAK